VGRIDGGLLIYLGVGQGDTQKDADYLAAKIAGLRIFQDEKGLMNASVQDKKLRALVISQFTLFGDVRRGRRPSFTSAMAPEKAETLYEYFVTKLESEQITCAKGQFGAMMKIDSTNDGPVTILLDSTKLF